MEEKMEKEKRVKHIFITGGVVSGLGKGITAASLGRLLKNRGYKVRMQKLDPYLNVDPGTMNPCEHGEVFVTADGAETDLDLGHYERFIDEDLDENASITSGKIYFSVLTKERKGEYLGKTVQVIPHITNEIKERIHAYEGKDIDILITEIGGTVGDIESQPFLEAIRQIGIEEDPEDVTFIHVTLVPYIAGSKELKSKPTQHSVKELQSLGIKPDILVCRSEGELGDSLKEKIALFCNVRKECVMENRTADILYEVPLMLEEQGLALRVCEKLHLTNQKPHNETWQDMITKIKQIKQKQDFVTIGIVGKYMGLEDAYLSVVESITHGGYANHVNTNIQFIDSEEITKEKVADMLEDLDGMIVPGGFGKRGIEGKITAITYARENKIPFLGICLGMQMAVIEFARNVVKIKEATSSELQEDAKEPVIHIMEQQKEITNKGGTMRLGNYPCQLQEGSYAKEIYGQKDCILRRHRHRYEYNNKYRQVLEQNGLRCSGISPDGSLVEMVEIQDHPFFVACQFHPELTSRPNHPEPLFQELIKKAKQQKKRKSENERKRF